MDITPPWDGDAGKVAMWSLLECHYLCQNKTSVSMPPGILASFVYGPNPLRSVSIWSQVYDAQQRNDSHRRSALCAAIVAELEIQNKLSEVIKDVQRHFRIISS